MGKRNDQRVMESIHKRITAYDWTAIAQGLNDKGFAILPGFLSNQGCETIKLLYNQEHHFRKTVVMERYRFGLGEYKYLQYPLPDPIQFIREHIYERLVQVGNQWMSVLKLERTYPSHHEQFIKECLTHNQRKPTVLVLKYGTGGHNTLHQDLYGEIFFPMQMVIMLSEPGVDFTGGELVLVQQTPRAQSKALVLDPAKGDAVIFSTNFRPLKGKNGYYRVNMKHGVSEVQGGERFTMGIIFHDALT